MIAVDTLLKYDSFYIYCVLNTEKVVGNGYDQIFFLFIIKVIGVDDIEMIDDVDNELEEVLLVVGYVVMVVMREFFEVAYIVRETCYSCFFGDELFVVAMKTKMFNFFSIEGSK